MYNTPDTTTEAAVRKLIESPAANGFTADDIFELSNQGVDISTLTEAEVAAAFEFINRALATYNRNNRY